MCQGPAGTGLARFTGVSAPTCLHAACSCPVAGNELYCSASCRTHAGRETAATTKGCDCGHPGCLGHAGKRGQVARGQDLDNPTAGA
jgi:hypothetical protein